MKGVYVDDTPGAGWLSNDERARYAISPMFNTVIGGAREMDSLIHVQRDPCPKCGVRGDIGCKHVRRAA